MPVGSISFAVIPSIRAPCAESYVNRAKMLKENHTLCAACAKVRIIRNRNGSEFFLCTVASAGSDWPRYPRQPVTRCEKFTPEANEQAGRR